MLCLPLSPSKLNKCEKRRERDRERVEINATGRVGAALSAALLEEGRGSAWGLCLLQALRPGGQTGIQSSTASLHPHGLCAARWAPRADTGSAKRRCESRPCCPGHQAVPEGLPPPEPRGPGQAAPCTWHPAHPSRARDSPRRSASGSPASPCRRELAGRTGRTGPGAPARGRLTGHMHCSATLLSQLTRWSHLPPHPGIVTQHRAQSRH